VLGQYLEDNLNVIRNYILRRSLRPSLAVDVAKIITEAYMESEGEPAIIRRAKVLLKIAQEIPIIIEDWQLIVGSPSAYNFTVAPRPDVCWRWVYNLDELETREGDKYEIPEDGKELLKDILPWWNGKSVEDLIFARLPEEIKNAITSGLFATGWTTVGVGTFLPNYERFLRKGIKGVIEEIEDKMKGLDLTDPKDYRKWLFYRAAKMSCEAISIYAKRFARLARELAEKETREWRRQELLIIAEICEWVSENPPRNFPEALQLIWFIHCMLYHDCGGGAGKALGRLDQILYPYYEDFVKKYGREVAKRWLKNFWVNQNQMLRFLPYRTTARIWSGHPVNEQPSIGGVDVNGNDACNDLTKLILEVEREVALPRPDIAVIYHDKIDPEVLDLACECLVKSMKPKFFNYDVMRKQLLARGIKEEDIPKGAAVLGCVTSGIVGKTWGPSNATYFNLVKALELALNNGVDPRTGKRIGPSTGDPTTFKTFDEFMQAVKEQVKYGIRLAIIFANVQEEVYREYYPQPLASVLVDDCIEKGLSVWEGGARYNIPGIAFVGLATFVDSLAAIKKFVFEERKLSMEELLNTLRNDFEGREDLRFLLREFAPKFGNDDDYVDSIAVEVVEFVANETMKYRCPRGVPYYPGFWSVSAHVGLGEFVGATPDGRRAYEALSDGASPTQGVIRKGPTAVIRSLTKIDWSKASSGMLLNMKFNDTLFRRYKDRFIALLRTYMKLGGYHVQFNIINTEVLRKAQMNPEQYVGLLVRVAAYIAEFTSLPKALQDDIIARSELGLE
jgi:formate C-acetyltransferase